MMSAMCTWDAIQCPPSTSRPYASAPPPPPSGNPEPSVFSGTAGTYMEEMYEAWTRDPKSVHASWDAYFRGSQYVAPPTVGTVSKRNECKQTSFGQQKLGFLTLASVNIIVQVYNLSN